MSYDDDKFGAIFPRRTGVPTGSANERAMLDALGGAASFKSGFRTNGDGSVTRLDTKNGNPQFSNTAPSTNAAAITDIYMESGQLSWNFPAPEAADRLDPAQWHFLDIPTTDAYLGRIVKITGEQNNPVALAGNQGSLAIGYPRSTDPATDAATKETYGNATLAKKLVMAWFAPSLYSGKMRLFLQSLYGAAESASGMPLELNVDSGNPVLNYTRNSATITLGLWPHNSPGILTDDNGYFWLVSITNPTGHEYVVTIYPITTGANVQGLVAYYRANLLTLDPDVKTKIEAYLFASSVIETSRPVAAGTFTAPAGGTLAYGWKFNSTGREASIVVNELLGTGAADYRWKSSTIRLSISSAGRGSAQTFSIDHATTTGGEWTDGWGVFNIFTPDNETSSAPLSLMSLKIDPVSVKPDFDFDVPVYGYYVADVWKPVQISRSVMTGPFPTHEWSDTGITYPASVDPTVYHANRYGLGGVLADQSCSYLEINISSGTSMNVTVDGATFAGRDYNGTRVTLDKQTSLTGATADNTVGFTGGWLGGAPVSLGDPPGFAGSGGAGDGLNHGGFVSPCVSTITRRVATGQMYEAWALVIPGGDSEAAYVATHKYDDTTITYATTVRVAYGVGRFFSIVSGYNFASWTAPDVGNEFFGSYGPDDVVTTNADPPVPYDTFVNCFNKVVHGNGGTPGGSYYALFNVDRSYPYYDRGMYTYTSNGLRYIMSEGLKSPASVTTARFVGWA